MKFDGIVAVVTGGASGLGAGVVKHLSALNAKVAILDMNADSGNDLAEDTGAKFYQADVNSAASLQKAFQSVEQDLGAVRILVNCAGVSAAPQRVVGRRGPYPEDLFRKIVDVNLTGCFLTSQVAISQMMPLSPEEGERGVIINVASIAGLDSPTGTIAYNASKAAVHSMTLTMARDMAPWGIRVCAIAPGSFDTPMMADALESQIPEILEKIPFPNSALGNPKHFAELAEHLIANPLINGETVRIDGAARLA